MDILELKREYAQFKEQIEAIRRSLDLAGRSSKITKLEEQTMKEGFWNDKATSGKIIKEMNEEKDVVREFENIETMFFDEEILIDFVTSGEEDFVEELEEKHNKLAHMIENFDTKMLLDGEYDGNNAIVTIHSGAGGTEACDWADMLYRMYMRWFNSRGFKVTEMDYMAGDSVGIKSVTLLVEGTRAYGYLKGEKGVHRLVRISPFDANKKRHTSFASVDIMPEVDDTIEINIDPGDLRVDTYRASGAGGQHVNMTDSAVRITHIPSGVVVTCQRERSQLSNRETAMKLLKSKLLEIEMKRKEEELKKIQGEQSEIGWGSQIRSYVFQPYTLVKDHRTAVESGNIRAVMDGDIDDFINGYLRWSKNKN
ncbi:MAG: peptide chain release factor 2 [Cetobacterium sp.]|uniref:peptide chain release factor 2 n=1 Tax=Cetobacterium sp. TaxID=2071632 RepID=UPI002FCC4391